MKFDLGKMFSELLEAGDLTAVELKDGAKPKYGAKNTVFYEAATLEIDAVNVNGFHATRLPIYAWLSEPFDKSSLELDIFDRLVFAVDKRSLQGKGFRLECQGFKDRTKMEPGKFEIIWKFIAKDYDIEDESVPAKDRARVVGSAPKMDPPKHK